MKISDHTIKQRHRLHEQPFDDFLLLSSKIYRKSRINFEARKGSYLPRVLSSPRSLGSLSLLDNVVEYSPVRTEIEWALSDRLQRKDEKYFEHLLGMTTNVFHEQNHRILWGFFRDKQISCPKNKHSMFSFLNFAESLVVALDCALGDELGLKKGQELYRYGVLYSPGSDVFKRFALSPRAYRNYLQLVRLSVFLRLEGMHPEDILPAIMCVASPCTEAMRSHAVKRALFLDERFVNITNPVWQGKHKRALMERMRVSGKDFRELRLSGRTYLENEPFVYLLTEGYLDLFGV